MKKSFLLKVRLVPLHMFNPASDVLNDRSKARLLFVDHFCYFCCAFLSVFSGLVVTCWDRTGLLDILCVMHYCVFAIFPYGVPSQSGYLILSFSDL